MFNILKSKLNIKWQILNLLTVVFFTLIFFGVSANTAAACTPGTTDWNYTCDNYTDVEVLGVGMGSKYSTGNNPAVINIPNPETVTSIRAQVLVKGDTSRVMFTTSEGEVKNLYSPTVTTAATGVYYEVDLDPAASVSAQVFSTEYAARSFFLYITRTTSEESYNSGKLPHSALYWKSSTLDDSHSETFSIPATSEPRDVDVTFAIGDLEDDCRVVDVKAQAGSVVQSATYSNSNLGYEAHLVTLTLHNVPGNVTEVTAMVTSPDNHPGTCDADGDGKIDDFGDSVYWNGVNVSAPRESSEPDPIDLELKKDVDNEYPTLGEEVKFTITVINTSSVSATNVSVRDVLPNGLTYISHSGGNYDSATHIWEIGTIDAGSQAMLKIIVKTEKLGVIKNVAEVWTADQEDVDSTPGNSDSGEDDQDNKQVEVKDTPNPPERKWEYACDDCVEVEVIGTGTGNINGSTNNPATLTINDPSSVDHILAQVAVRRVWGASDLKPEKVVISSSAGETYTLTSPTIDTGGVGEYIYEVEFSSAATITAEVFGESVNGNFSPRSFEAYIFRNNTNQNKKFNSGKLLSDDLRANSKTETFSIPTTNTTRDVEVQFVISEFENDESVTFTATAGSTTKTETISTQSDGDELLVYTLTLNDVAGDVDEMSVTATSPTSSDSIVWTGVNVAVQCVYTEPEYFIDVQKDVDKTVASIGDELIYTIHWSVNGNKIASAVTLVDTLPEDVAFVEASNGGLFSGLDRSITWNLGDKNPGDSGTETIKVIVKSSASHEEILVNEVVMTSGTKTDSDTAQTEVNNPPTTEINIVKDVDKTQAYVGDNLKYTIKWDVLGNTPATNATVTDTLPAEVSFVSTEKGGVYDADTHTITWTLGDIYPAETDDYEVVVKIESTPSDNLVNNLAEIRSDKYYDSDTATTTIIEKPDYELHITKTGPAVAAPTETFDYIINWSITGNTTATNVIITDTLPTEIDVLSTNGGGNYTSVFDKLIWSLGDKQPGDSGTITVTARVKNHLENGDQFTNYVRIDSGTKFDEDSATTEVSNAYYTVNIEKSADVTEVMIGENVIYTLDWSIGGNKVAPQVVITDYLPEEVSFVDASNGGVYDSNTHQVVWDLGDHSAGDSGSFTIEVTAASYPTIGDDFINNTKIESGSLYDTSSAIVKLVDYDVHIIKDGPAQAQVGDKVTYTISWSISGTATATDVIITDTLPTGTTFDSASGTYTTPVGEVVWNLGDKKPGDSGSLAMTVVFDGVSVGDNVVNNVEIVSGTKSDQADATTEVVDETVYYYNVDIKKIGPSQVNTGDDITYTVTWTITGNMVAPNVIITDTLPTNTSFVSASGSYTENNGVLTWSLGDIDATDTNVNSAQFTVTVNTSGLGNGTTVVNNTEITSGNKSDQDSVTTIIKAGGGGPYHNVYIEKAAPAEINAGDGITFTFFWRVTGTEISRDVIVTDTLPADVTFVSANNSGVYDANKHEVIWKLGDQHQGNTGSLKLVVATDADDFSNGDTIVNNVTIRSGVETDDDTTTTLVKKGGGGSSDFELDITKTGPTSIKAGSDINYTITWSVTGNKIAQDVVITDILPENAIFSTATGAYTYDPTTGEIVWALGNIAPAQSGTFQVVLNTNSNNLVDGEVINNQVKIKSGNKEKGDDTSTVVTKEGNLVPHVTLEYDYPLNKTNGYSYTEQVRVINDGQIILTNGALWIDLDETVLEMESTDRAIAFGDVKKQMFKWSIPTLAVGETYTLNFVVSVFDQDVYHMTDTYVAYFSDQADARTKGSEWVICPDVWYYRGEYGLSRGVGSLNPDDTYQGPATPHTIPLSSPVVLPIVASSTIDTTSVSNPVVTIPEVATPVVTTPGATVPVVNKPTVVIEDTKNKEPLVIVDSGAEDSKIDTTPVTGQPNVESAASTSQVVVVNNPTNECQVCEVCDTSTVCAATADKCTTCGTLTWLVVIMVQLLGLLIYWFYVSKEDIKENSDGEYYIVKGNWGWILPVFLVQLVTYLMLVYVCNLVPYWVLLIVILSYFLALVFHQALLKNGELKFSPGLPVMITVGVLAVYLLCESWGVGTWIAVLLFYILTLATYYVMLIKMSPKSRSYWWIVVLLLTILVIILEMVLRNCQCGKIIS